MQPRTRYYALLYIFGQSIVFSLLWGFARWAWLSADTSLRFGSGLTTVLIPILLTALHLYLCRHYIRGIHDSKERYVWCGLSVLSFLLFSSAGLYVEMRFSPFLAELRVSKMMVQAWQLVLLIEALALFLVYRSYYVVEEYEESAKAAAEASAQSKAVLSGFLTKISLSKVLIFGVVPLVMLCMFIVEASSDDFSKHQSQVLLDCGSLHYVYVLQKGEWWRLITHGFLHVDVMHLLSNLVCYYYCMVALNRKYNGYLLFAVFMLSVFGSGLFVVMFSNSINAGASGGVFGLMAFWALDEYKNTKEEIQKGQHLSPHKHETKTVFTLLGYNLAQSFGSGIGTSSHLGGCFVGAILWLLSRQRSVPVWAVASFLLVLASFGIHNHRSGIMKSHSISMNSNCVVVDDIPYHITSNGGILVESLKETDYYSVAEGCDSEVQNGVLEGTEIHLFINKVKGLSDYGNPIYFYHVEKNDKGVVMRLCVVHSVRNGYIQCVQYFSDDGELKAQSLFQPAGYKFEGTTYYNIFRKRGRTYSLNDSLVRIGRVSEHEINNVIESSQKYLSLLVAYTGMTTASTMSENSHIAEWMEYDAATTK